MEGYGRHSIADNVETLHKMDGGDDAEAGSTAG
jgi:hypothetical protein